VIRALELLAYRPNVKNISFTIIALETIGFSLGFGVIDLQVTKSVNTRD
jgi:hypothetical protein